MAVSLAETLQDSIHMTTLFPPAPNSRHVLIYFIPGNPGLIEYYRHFLTSLSTLLSPLAETTGSAFHLVGNSLAGFHTRGRPSRASDGRTKLPLNLRQQIEDVERNVQLTTTSIRDHFDVRDTQFPVILVGHSVGAYILMSALERHHHHRTSQPPNNATEIIAGIPLFPTIVDLHLSPSGQKAAWTAHIPYFSHLLHLLARLLTASLPFASLVNLIQSVTGHPEPAAHVTGSFLASPLGVRQAIYLAQHELLEMRADNFSDSVWGASPPATAASSLASPSRSAPSSIPLFFYWGASDHWIANSTRDAVIAARATTAARPTAVRMEVDSKGTPHDFCIREEHSQVVAEKVKGYVGEILEGLR